MTLRGVFSYNQSDSTSDMNSHIARIIDKGIFNGGTLILSSTALEVTVTPFIAVGYDGMVTISDSSTVVSIPVNATSYLVCYAKWLSGVEPHIEISVVTEANWLTSSERNYYITFAKLVVPLGATYINSSYVSYSSSDYADKLGKNSWRNRVSDYSLLPTVGNRHGDTRVADDRAYQWDSSTSSWISLLTNDNTNLVISNWSTRATGSSFPLRDVAISGKHIVTVGDSDGVDAAIYVSHDNGVTFATVASGVTALKSAAVMDVGGSPVFVAVGELTGSGVIIASVDNGATWSTVTTTPTILNKVKTFDGTKMVAVGEVGAIFYSDDPATAWDDYTDTVISGNINDIASNGVNNWVVACDGAINQNSDITVTFGWATVVSLGASNALSCDYGNSMFVVGVDDTLYVSSDGINYSNITGVIPTGYAASKIKYIDDYRLFLMFSDDGGTSGVAYHFSSGGVFWDDLSGAINTTYTIGGIAIDARTTPCIVDSQGYVHFGLRS